MIGRHPVSEEDQLLFILVMDRLEELVEARGRLDRQVFELMMDEFEYAANNGADMVHSAIELFERREERREEGR